MWGVLSNLSTVDVTDLLLGCTCQGLLDVKLLKSGGGAMYSSWWEALPADVRNKLGGCRCQRQGLLGCMGVHAKGDETMYSRIV